MTGRAHLPAGRFSSWLADLRAALIEGRGSDVPCGGCTACCTSSYFVHIESGESRTLARIVPELVFAAPGAPGRRLLGYDRRGRCPLLTAGETCSIYDDRPLTCRVYDCRVFAAAGISADREAITRRARRWRFDCPTADDRDRLAAVRAAARFLTERAECFPGGAVPDDPAQLALLAIKTYPVFLAGGEGSARPLGAAAWPAVAAAVVGANEAFEAHRGSGANDAPGRLLRP
jgi:uncharacterized protein